MARSALATYNDFVRDDRMNDQDMGVDVPRICECLTWALLRGTIESTNENLAAQLNRLDDPFCLPDLQIVTLRDRLGPLVIALLLNNQDDIAKLIENLSRTIHLSADQITWVNEALIFTAAHGNIDVLNYILDHFNKILSQYHLGEALKRQRC